MSEIQDKEFVEYIVKAIVEFPDDVTVDRKVDEMGVLISLGVNPSDMGKIIGKEGHTVNALRTLLRVMGAKSNARINLKILEPEGSERPQRRISEDDSTTTPLEEKATEVV
ncbi:RNA-binding protein [Candidatus Berkelbacteria bacterium CG_4_9_14_3_um_filter_39_23]|uniref:RNA-binding protein KhpA n=2 Tax=Candidatus Berkelbacteria TaxID=1618330 RepID=A0A2M7CIW7_9BACT|nr:KH domain-containing protein [Candidatus Berkelbacteria bacterium]OIP04804.1 MAG: RNA-binding protein [Candidatus Berkelbacteria bacterium CG2_30_39_44]PIR28017.1 MAG: RNA-binding protein [Candidatus Berkelbacteria bacterium CG11_big_fil_rev_8_21_14_0_20_40_23]PIV25591.1 MAG: RNA-binding protein [Candidatus Berkelbacteria bacterium CG03_land_8_20_14_0_80_40_36]PIX30473.1 MAG: RNA-binding protein [Candidatus Berkelbacteria bacterium CG_4_8_14_3_um_filter_39_27]PIZ28574.1 MAG: RNA-binding pro